MASQPDQITKLQAQFMTQHQNNKVGNDLVRQLRQPTLTFGREREREREV